MGIVNNGIDGRGNSKLGIVNGWRDMRCVAEMSDTLIDSQHPEMGRGNSMLLGRKGGEGRHVDWCYMVVRGYICVQQEMIHVPFLEKEV